MAIDIMAANARAEQQQAEREKAEKQKYDAAATIMVSGIKQMDEYGTGDEMLDRAPDSIAVLKGEKTIQGDNPAHARHPELVEFFRAVESPEVLRMLQSEPNLLTEFLRYLQSVRQHGAPQQPQRAINSAQVIEQQMLSPEASLLVDSTLKGGPFAHKLDDSTDNSLLKQMERALAVFRPSTQSEDENKEGSKLRNGLAGLTSRFGGEATSKYSDEDVVRLVEVSGKVFSHTVPLTSISLESEEHAQRLADSSARTTAIPAQRPSS